MFGSSSSEEDSEGSSGSSSEDSSSSDNDDSGSDEEEDNSSDNRTRPDLPSNTLEERAGPSAAASSAMAPKTPSNDDRTGSAKKRF